MPNIIPESGTSSTAKSADVVEKTSIVAKEFNAALNVESFNIGSLSDISRFESLLHHVDVSVFNPPTASELADLMGLYFSNANIMPGKEAFIKLMCKPTLHSVNIWDVDGEDHAVKALKPNDRTLLWHGIGLEVRLTAAGAVMGLRSDKAHFDQIINNTGIAAWNLDGNIQDVGRPIPWYVTTEHVTIINGKRVRVSCFYDVPITAAMRFGIYAEGLVKFGSESSSDFTGVQILRLANYQHDGGSLPEKHTLDYFCNKDMGTFRTVTREFQVSFNLAGAKQVLSAHDLFMVLPSAIAFVINKIYPRLDKHFNKTLTESEISALVSSGSEFSTEKALKIQLAKISVTSNRYKQLQEIAKGITAAPFQPNTKGTDNASVNQIKELLNALFPGFTW